MNSIFKFKRFDVDQTNCAMKINTDGVLLALMAEADQPGRILDIGTGTGVLALILAQRYDDAFVDAVEIDEQACETANGNFIRSVFAQRLKIHHIDVAAYQTAEKYDLIVSNPPYFVNDLRNSDQKKGLARHAEQHFFDLLIAKVEALLSPAGNFWFILPVKQAELLIENAKGCGLHLFKQIHLHSDAYKPEFRRIVGLSRDKRESQNERFNIYAAERVYTPAYRELLKDFFLAY